jgi:hypothetical protein
MTATAAVFTQSPYPRGQDMTQRRFLLAGTLAIGASPLTYPAGGIPITIAANNNNSGGIDFPGVSNGNAVRATLDSRAGSGYIYKWTTKDLWTAVFKGNAVAAGQSLIDSNGNIQTCTTPGTAGSGAEPTWALPTAANPNPTTVDGTVTWTLELWGANCGLVQIFQSAGSAAPLVELTQAASIPAAVSSDLISCLLEFIKG